MNITIISDCIYAQTDHTTATMAKGFNERGHKVNIILPFYEARYADRIAYTDTDSITVRLPQGNYNITIHSFEKEGINYYLISNKKLFAREKEWGYRDDVQRTAVYCTAALETLRNTDIEIDCIITDCENTALIPVFLKFKYNTYSKFRNVKSYHYINRPYNITYDKSSVTSVFGLSPEERHIFLCKNEVNLTKAAIICASRIFVGESEISLLYDRNNELHHTVVQFGFKIRKIRLGIDYSIFSPDCDNDIHKCFSWESVENKSENKLFVQNHLSLKENKDIPLVVLYAERNREFFYRHLQDLLRCDIQLIIISDNTMASDISISTDRCICIPDRSSKTLKNIFSAADFCIFGALGSECGNPAFIAAAYGCVPILPFHRFYNHGFNYFNKLTYEGNGYTYDPDNSNDMMYTLWDALAIYRHNKKAYLKLLCNTMKKVFSSAEGIETIEKEAEKTCYSLI